MTTHTLLDAIGLINDKAINEAKQYHAPAIRWKKWAAIAAAFVVVCGIGIWGVINGFNTVTPTPPSYDYSPSFMVNNQVFWSFGGSASGLFDSLPDGYSQAGVIEEIVSKRNKDYFNEYKNYQADFGNVGDKIFLNAEKPYAAYVYTDLFAEKGDFHYVLFVTHELRERMVFYNGRLYKYVNQKTIEPQELLPDYKLIGCVENIELDVIPDSDLQSNADDFMDCDVYASITETDTIYLVSSSGEGYVLKVK